MSVRNSNSVPEPLVFSPAGKVETLPGYTGPKSETDLPYALPPRKWSPIVPRMRRKAPVQVKLAAATLTQVDGRVYTVDQTWSGLRFLFKVDRLAVAPGGSVFNLFTTHLGREIGGVPNWTEIGVIRAQQDQRYRLFTYDPYQNPQYMFFGEMHPGEVFEFAIRLNESDAGPYRYETFCSGVRVRQGTLPTLDCQVDLSHETWTESNVLTDGDGVSAFEGWVNYRTNKARWFDTGVKTQSYTTNPGEKRITFGAPRSQKFTSAT